MFCLLQIAAPLVEACIENGKWPEEASETRDRVFVEYAKYLVSLINIEVALWYCERAGDRGAQLGGELKLCAS